MAFLRGGGVALHGLRRHALRLGLRDGGKRAFPLRIDALQRKLLGSDLRLRLVARDEVVAIVQRHQRIAGRDVLVRDHLDVRDLYQKSIRWKLQA